MTGPRQVSLSAADCLAATSPAVAAGAFYSNTGGVTPRQPVYAPAAFLPPAAGAPST
jgi:hypothetical protein